MKLRPRYPHFTRIIQLYHLVLLDLNPNNSTSPPHPIHYLTPSHLLTSSPYLNPTFTPHLTPSPIHYLTPSHLISLPQPLLHPSSHPLTHSLPHLTPSPIHYFTPSHPHLHPLLHPSSHPLTHSLPHSISPPYLISLPQPHLYPSSHPLTHSLPHSISPPYLNPNSTPPSPPPSPPQLWSMYNYTRNYSYPDHARVGVDYSCKSYFVRLFPILVHFLHLQETRHLRRTCTTHHQCLATPTTCLPLTFIYIYIFVSFFFSLNFRVIC